MNKLMIRHTMDKPLPYDAEVEYIESTGTQYIDTRLTPSANLILQFGFVNINRTGDVIVGTFPGDYGDYRFFNANDQCYFDTPNGRRIEGSNCYQNKYYEFELGNYYVKDLSTGSMKIQGTAGITSNTAHIGICGDVYNHRSNNRIYWFKGYVSNELKIDLIPVRKGGIGYMYDKVSGQLFANQGTGDFVVGPDYNHFAYQYLTFVPLEDSTFSFSKRGTGNDIEYSIDGGAWTSLASEANTPTVGAGHNIRWRAELTPITSGDNPGIGTFAATGLYDAMGNTMSLLYSDNYIGQTTLVGTFTFRRLWYNNAYINRTNNLILPAIKMESNCYLEMFRGCANLLTAPNLPATTLAARCYAHMFIGCTNLLTAPELPAITLTERCYINLFRNCRKIANIKMLATNISATNCLQTWLSGVATTGTFVKNAAMTTLPTGTSGIPSGWTVVDDPSTINS